jgi:hypothetical protein
VAGGQVSRAGVLRMTYSVLLLAVVVPVPSEWLHVRYL